jgi:phosphoglycerate dehydrogenase-like enzyme
MPVTAIRNFSRLEPAGEVPAVPRRGTILVAVNRLQLRQFFPEGLPAEMGGDPVVACEMDGLGSAEWAAQLDALRPTVVITGWSTPPIPHRCTAPGHGSIAYVCHLTGSVRAVVAAESIAAGLMVSNWGGLAAPMVAEHALLLALAALRNLPAWPAFMQRPFVHDDKEVLATRTLHQRRVALHGFGAVARALLRILKPFEVEVTAFSEGVAPQVLREHGVKPAASLVDLYAGAEILLCCEALTPLTRRSVCESTLERLVPGAVFVNVGRGAVVDEAALGRVAVARGLRVALDVTVEEPPAPDSPLRAIPGIILSPHIAGPTIDRYRHCGDLALANVQAYLRGQRPLNLVDQPTFERST